MFRSALKALFSVGRGAAMAPVNPIIALIGAPGTGKSQVPRPLKTPLVNLTADSSQLAVEIATRHNGEIINGDAMQLYEGLPVITNKMPESERQGVPHHLLGEIGLQDEPWTVMRFVKEASRVVCGSPAHNPRV